MAAKGKRKRKLNLWRLVIMIVLLLTVIGLGAGVGFVVGIVRNMPNWSPEDDFQMKMTTFIYDANGKKVEELHGAENRIPVDFEKIPSELKMAFLAIEDVRFYEHYGVDPKAITRALLANLTSGTIKEGGSTITQQLAKNAFIENPEQTLKRKIQEAMMAIELERTYKKEEIFEFYLNQIYFGEGAYGVQAAAQTYFGKNVQDLTLPESALLAGIVKSPHARYNPYKNPDLAKQRRNLVLDNMAKYQLINQQEADEAKKADLVLTERKITSQYKYPYFIDYVASTAQELLEENGMSSSQLYTGGLRIYTTLDTKVQQSIETAFANKELFPAGEGDQMVQAAMAVVDPSTGAIRGLMGGREHVTNLGLNRAVRQDEKSGRQPGSAIKPLAVYGAALEQGYAPASVIDDVPTSYDIGQGQTYTPHNYDNRYRGLISMREALRWSINAAAAKWLNTIGVNTGYQFAKNLGLPLNEQDKYLSLALGGITHGVTPVEMAAAYGTFANRGIWVEPNVITRIEDSEGNVLITVKPTKRDVMSPQNAYLMTDMLQTVVQAGTGTRAKLSRPTAGKTGTVQLPPDLAKKVNGTKDAWFVGYTPELAAAVWMGYDKTDEKHYLKGIGGSSYPAMLWKATMENALEGIPQQEFTRPEGIVYSAVDAKSGLLPSELTPPEYVLSEIFTSQSMPKDVSGVWVKKKIDPQTGQLATPYCPETVEKVFLQRPIPYTGEQLPEDASLEAPTEECTLHGPRNTALQTVYICTDPRHTTPVLALIPRPGQQGGCPIGEIAEVQLPPGNVPHTFCDIPEHQLSGPAGGFQDDTSGQEVPPVPTAGGSSNKNQLDPPSLQAEVDPNTASGQPVVALKWGIKGSANNLQFKVERWRQGEQERTVLGTVEEFKLVDWDTARGKTFYYQVIVQEKDGSQSAPSNIIEVKVP